MSRLDQAFIKAYAKDSAGAAPASPHIPLAGATTGRSVANWPAAVAYSRQRPAASAPPQSSSFAVPWGERTQDPGSPMTAAEPAPAAKTRAVSSPSAADSAALPREAAAAPLHLTIDVPHELLSGPHWHQSSRRDAGSPPHLAERAAVSRPIAKTPSLVPVNESWGRPAYEVDQFQWPALITELVNITGADLDATAHRLVTAARNGQKVVAIGGVARGAGSTTLLICLAQRLSAMRLKAVLVDADFIEPSLARRLGLGPQFGWQDIRDHDRSVPEVLVESIGDGLTLLPLSRPLTGNAKLADEVCWPATLDALRERYHLVLIDGGPLESDGGEEPAWLGGNWGIDAAIVVGEAGDESHRDLAVAVERLHGRGIQTVGVVENFCARPADHLLQPHRPHATVSFAGGQESIEEQTMENDQRD